MSRATWQGVAQTIEDAIRLGRYSAGAQIPSVRALATQLDASPAVVQRAMEHLRARGLVTTVPGGGTYVADGVRDGTPLEARVAALEEQVQGLRAEVAELRGHPPGTP